MGEGKRVQDGGSGICIETAFHPSGTTPQANAATLQNFVDLSGKVKNPSTNTTLGGVGVISLGPMLVKPEFLEGAMDGIVRAIDYEKEVTILTILEKDNDLQEKRVALTKEKRALTDVVIQVCRSIRQSGRLPSDCQIEIPTEDTDPMAKMERLSGMVAALLAESQAQDVTTRLEAQEKAFRDERDAERSAWAKEKAALGDSLGQMRLAFEAKLENTQMGLAEELRDSQGKLGTWEERAQGIVKGEANLESRRMQLENEYTEAKETIKHSQALIQEKMDLQRQVHRLNKDLQESQTSATQRRYDLGSPPQAGGGGGGKSEDHALLEKLMGSDIKDLEQALAESAALLEEQKKGQDAMRGRVGELEDECTMLRLEMVTGPAQFDQKELHASVQRDIEAKSSEMEVLQRQLAVAQGDIIALQAKSIAAQTFAEESAAMRSQEMRRAQEAEKREAEARTNGAQLMAEEAMRWAAMSTGKGEVGGASRTTKAMVKDVIALTKGWRTKEPCKAVLVLELPKELLTPGAAQSTYRDDLAKDVSSLLVVPRQQVYVDSFEAFSNKAAIAEITFLNPASGDDPPLPSRACRDLLRDALSSGGGVLMRGKASRRVNSVASLNLLGAAEIGELKGEAKAVDEKLKEAIESDTNEDRLSRLEVAAARAQSALEVEEEMAKLRATLRLVEAQKVHH